jgi:Ca2+/Na+ antiporter
MKKSYIRWLFIIGFVIFAVMMRHYRLIYTQQNLFVILWLLASFITVGGVVLFRDKLKD